MDSKTRMLYNFDWMVDMVRDWKAVVHPFFEMINTALHSAKIKVLTVEIPYHTVDR